MKVRIGVGTGTDAPLDAEGYAAFVEDLEDLGFDSLWLPEVLTAGALDPLVGLATAAARTRRLKLGTTVVLPGRNPARLAKELATLDRLSGGRLLVTFVLGLAEPAERQALGLAGADRGALVDEALPLVRRWWAGEAVDHDGPRFSYRGVAVAPTPVQSPLEAWLGGTAPSALRRAGRLADGWLPSLLTPEEAAAGRRVVEIAAAEAGRAVDPEHFGLSVAYTRRGLDGPAVQRVAARRPGVDPGLLVPVGLPALRATVERFVEVGFSKFVVRPAERPASWRAELEDLAACLLDLQT